MYLAKKSKNWKQKMLASLENKEEYEKVMYWRKAYELHEGFCNILNVENCEYVKVEEEELLELIEHLELNMDLEAELNSHITELNKVITETDWENEEIYYYAWW